MREPSFSDALQVLLLQVADEGRGDVLFGESLSRLANEVGPFMIGEEFPSVYLECPLIGDPFIDITVLYSKLEPGTHVEHPAASGTEAIEKIISYIENISTFYFTICRWFYFSSRFVK